MHVCAECGSTCDCGGDISPSISVVPSPDCSHCTHCCEHGVSFNLPCEHCELQIHSIDDQIDASDQTAPGLFPSHNGGW